MKKSKLRELGIIGDKVESVENPVEKVFEEVIEEIKKPRGRKKKEV